MKCALCGKEINDRDSHNGNPLVDGRVCSVCNWKVIKERMKAARKEEKPAEEQVAVTGTCGPVGTVDPMADFEKYAKQFEDTFILGKTPIRKERAENKTKVVDGQVTGEVKSLEKEESSEQVEPIKSATESYAEARPNSSRLLEMVDDGVADLETLAKEFIDYLSDDEIGEFCNKYGYFPD